jgi:uncharacterized membrane protein (UPF0127 family)
VRKIISALFVVYCLLFVATPVKAIVEPLGVPNNRVGVHILDPNEIGEAAKLVNTSGGDWGYVTIPMRSNDRDFEKWQKFFNSAKTLHLIPIIRLATYPVENVWETPTVYDLVDFANFLSEMPWSTKNRYVILFNEPNHANEWGGQVDPYDYARLLVDAKQIFKSRSQDFFLLSAGLDMSVPNSSTSREALLFYQQMTAFQPDWYDSIDGLSVHAYPNPGFSASAFSTNRYGITSFRYEKTALAKYGYSGKPIFITETGTILQNDFYKSAFTQVWTDPDIVAITPFVLFAGSPDFASFSLLNAGHLPKKTYNDIYSLTKISGSPLLSDMVFSQSPKFDGPVSASPVFVQSLSNFWTNLFKVKTHTLHVRDTTINITIADNEITRAKGLSGKNKLEDLEGMLFKFQSKGFWQFWMNDMHFALDFIWINDNKIVELSENALPPSQTNNQPQILTPHQPIDSVLEVNSGFIKAHNLQIGDVVDIN